MLSALKLIQFDQLMEFLGGLEDVLDDTRESILENRMMLNAKKAVLI